MRLRKFFVGMFLMSSSLSALEVFSNSVLGHALRHNNRRAMVFDKAGTIRALHPAPSLAIKGDKLLSTAYYDTLSILMGSNRCSEYFGGATFAVKVFDEFAARIDKSYFSKTIGMRMSGNPSAVFDPESKKHYRMFEKVAVNEDGPFYRRRFVNSGSSPPNIGSFEPGTKEVRVLILLHELGHLIQDAQGEWLLPNDGYDEELSRKNSRRIEGFCREEILALSKSTGILSPVKRKDSEGHN